MYGHVAVRAVLIAWIRHIVELGRHELSSSGTTEITGPVMAFEAHGEHDRSPEEARIRGAVRVMTHLTAFHPDRWVFECKGAAFIVMALDAGFFVSEGLIHQFGTRRHAPRCSKRAVRVVTVTADHEALIHAVLKGHGEVGPDATVTAVTKFRLIFRQQEVRRRRFVDRVALRTRDVIKRVR